MLGMIRRKVMNPFVLALAGEFHEAIFRRG